MQKILFICGSAKNGTCKTLLEKLQKNFWLEYSTEIVFIRDFNLKPCVGCHTCENGGECLCVNDDRMNILIDNILDAEIVVLATPNYFYNVSGLTKTMIDRLYPLYKDQKLQGKKFIYLYTGNDETSRTKKFLDNALYGFTACQAPHVLGSFAFCTNDDGTFAEPDKMDNDIQSIVTLIKNNIE